MMDLLCHAYKERRGCLGYYESWEGGRRLCGQDLGLYETRDEALSGAVGKPLGDYCCFSEKMLHK